MKKDTLDRRPEWSEAQYQVFVYWFNQPKAQTRTEVPRDALEQGEKRRRIEAIEDRRRVAGEIREVWECGGLGSA